MDNLSSLSSGLPVRASAQHELADLDNRLMTEFKSAASAVTKLFKLAGSKTALAHDQGYADALQDLLDALDADPALDARSWAIQKLMEATGQARYTSGNTSNTDGQADDAALKDDTETASDDVRPPTSLFTFEAGPHLPDTVPQDKLDDEITFGPVRPGSKRRAPVPSVSMGASKRQKQDDDVDDAPVSSQ